MAVLISILDGFIVFIVVYLALQQGFVSSTSNTTRLVGIIGAFNHFICIEVDACMIRHFVNNRHP